MIAGAPAEMNRKTTIKDENITLVEVWDGEDTTHENGELRVAHYHAMYT